MTARAWERRRPRLLAYGDALSRELGRPQRMDACAPRRDPIRSSPHLSAIRGEIIVIGDNSMPFPAENDYFDHRSG
jgi:hypothetical protein